MDYKKNNIKKWEFEKVYFVSTKDLKFQLGILKITNKYFRFYKENETDFHWENAVDYIAKKWYFVVGAKEFNSLKPDEQQAIKAFMINKLSSDLKRESVVIEKHLDYLKNEPVKGDWFQLSNITDKAEKSVKNALKNVQSFDNNLLYKGEILLAKIHGLSEKQIMWNVYKENKWLKNDKYWKALKWLYEHGQLKKYEFLLNKVKEHFPEVQNV